MKFKLIRFLDWIDDKFLGHYFHPLCVWIAHHPWWDAKPKDKP